MQDMPSIPAHPVKSHGECLSAEQAPRASQSPPHDFGLPVVRWQTYARGLARCKHHQKNPPVARHTQQKAAGSGYESADANSPRCPAPRLRPPEKAPGDLREGLCAVPAVHFPMARHTRYTATGSALCGVERSLSPHCPPHPAKSRREWLLGCRMLGRFAQQQSPHTPKVTSGSGGADAACTEGQQHVSGGLSPLHLDKQPSR
ncbi:MAG: hypothetical protein NT140_01370 [Deltaproteobacteria bacterium]|nr:hypothetical protein [Deltaproteobacteria bacterium]